MNADDNITKREQLLETLKEALRKDGDFPANARAVNKLQTLAADPNATAEEVTEVVLTDPSLGSRILHIVNSSYYRRQEAIMTVSHAIVQLGTKAVVDLCSSFVLLQRFIHKAESDSALEYCLHRTLLTASFTGLLHETIDTDHKKEHHKELGYLIGSFTEIGLLLLGYYFPKILEKAFSRSKQKNITLDQSISELTGMNPIKLSLEVLIALELPEYYISILTMIEAIEEDANELRSNEEGLASAKLVHASQKLCRMVFNQEDKSTFEAELFNLEQELRLSKSDLENNLARLPMMLDEQSSALELPSIKLPDYLSQLQKDARTTEPRTEIASNESQDFFQPFVKEIRDSIANNEDVTVVISKVMNTLTEQLDFDRAVLLVYDEDDHCLVGASAVGLVHSIDPTEIVSLIDNSNYKKQPEILAFTKSKPVFKGKTLLSNAWPFAYIPVGFDDNAVGVIYVDRIEDETENSDISSRDQAIIQVLSELLEELIESQ